MKCVCEESFYKNLTESLERLNKGRLLGEMLSIRCGKHHKRMGEINKILEFLTQIALL